MQDTASQGSYSEHHYHHKEQIKINDLNDNNLIEVRKNNIHLINNLIISVVLLFYLNLFYFLFLHTHTGNLLLNFRLPLDYYFKKGN